MCANCCTSAHSCYAPCEGRASLLNAANAFREGWTDLVTLARPEGTDTPARHAGGIASGGDVIASKDLIAAYRKDMPKLIGVEMEGGGVAAALHGHVLRPPLPDGPWRERPGRRRGQRGHQEALARLRAGRGGGVRGRPAPGRPRAGRSEERAAVWAAGTGAGDDAPLARQAHRP